MPKSKFTREQRVVWLLSILSAFENCRITNQVTKYRWLRNDLIRKHIPFLKPDCLEVSSYHWTLSDIVKRQLPERFEHTPTQRKIKLIISKRTKILFFENYLIGQRPVDIFIPSLSSLSNKMRGLVIEIDGSIHDQEWKMKRDEKTSDLLRSLGIAHTVIRNEDVNHSLTDLIVNRLSKTNRICS